MSQYDFQIQHRLRVHHGNTDTLSCQEMDGNYCDCYNIDQKVEDLPCGGCDHCSRVHKSWKWFAEDVNDVVPLAIRTVGVSKEERAIADSPGSENGAQNDTLSRELAPDKVSQETERFADG